MNTLKTLRKHYQQTRPASKILFIAVVAIILMMSSLLLIVPAAHNFLSVIQWILNYYPEDPDPEFLISLLFTDVLWTTSLIFLLLHSLGVEQQAWIRRCSSGYIVVVMLCFVTSSMLGAIFFFQ